MIYSDFSIDFAIHPIKSDLFAIHDVKAIIQSIQNIVFTDKYERPFQPTYGAGINQTLFDNAQADYQFLIHARLQDAINNSEPRIKDLDIQVIDDLDRNTYSATITFTPININEPITITAVFRRIR